jgi:hypothetical protein
MWPDVLGAELSPLLLDTLSDERQPNTQLGQPSARAREGPR